MTSIKQQLNLKPINYCLPGLLSKCGAGTTWAEHRHCSFSIKSGFANKCMYYNQSLEGHCDNVDAQKDAITIVEG